MNPQNNKIEYENLSNIITKKYKSTMYYCYCKEIGSDNGTPHFHIFLCTKNAIYGSGLIATFKGAHIEVADGTYQENRDYIFKTGKWEEDPKAITKIEGMQYESGECPIEEPGKRNDLDKLRELLLEGKTNAEIYGESASYMRFANNIDRIRQDLIMDKYKNVWRNLEVTYMHGITGAGKTREIMEKYGYSNVYRVTGYKNPFDSYQGQDVIIFEEFRSSLKIEDMLNYLDGYPVDLPSRYNNKQACFTKIYINSNWTLAEQFKNVQDDYPQTWEALLRRIHNVVVYDVDGITEFKQIKINEGEYDYVNDCNVLYFSPSVCCNPNMEIKNEEENNVDDDEQVPDLLSITNKENDDIEAKKFFG